MAKKIPTTPKPPATTEPAETAAPEVPASTEFETRLRAPPAAFLKRQGLGKRDIDFLDQYAEALAEVREAIYAGNAERARRAAPVLVRLPRDAERLLGIARRAYSVRTSEE